MAPAWPFAGLPAGWDALFGVVLAVIAGMFAWNLLLFVRGRRSTAAPPPASEEDVRSLTWVFLVPALNEEITIRDSVQRLLDLELPDRRVVVVDDDSDDETAAILADMNHPDLFVLRRTRPHARQGKAQALNHAYRALGEVCGDPDRDRVIVVIVDADGRLDPSAPLYAASHFRDPRVAGVQALVRIYNRRRPLTWLQDVEFSVYGQLFQAGRNDWGTAGMGGNGQFNRLSALDDIAEADGPWRDRLTEDQDLGLRLIAAGWRGRQDVRAVVEQQGPPTLRRLLDQRTRWSQGNLQAMGLAPAIRRAPLPLVARTELLAYLLMPFWQAVVGVGLASALFLAATGVAPFWHGGPTWQLALFYLLAFGGSILGCIASRAAAGPAGWASGFVIAHPYALYTWLLWPVLVRSAIRQLSDRREWSKTEREPLEPAGASRAIG